MRPAHYLDTRSAIIDGVLQRSLQTAGDGHLVDTIARLELFLRRYPDNLLLQGALFLYLPRLLQESRGVLPQTRQREFESKLQALQSNASIFAGVHIVIEIFAKDAQFLEPITTYPPAQYVTVTVDRFDGSSDLAHVLVLLSPATLPLIADVVTRTMAEGRHIRLSREGTYLLCANQHDVITALADALPEHPHE